MSEICIFAGTSEGRRLVEALRGRGLKMTVCVATEYGGEMLGAHADVEIHTGRRTQAEMAELLRTRAFELVVDATHPYADQATENIASACAEVGVEYLRLQRSGEAESADGVFVESAQACVEYLRATQGNILLTTGSKELPAFAPLRERLYARVLPMQESLKLCADCGVAPDHILAMQGPFDEEMNLAMLRAVRASYMVTKDTGGAGGYGAKIRAAKRAGVQAVIIGRPPQREGMALEEVLRRIEERFALAPVRKKVTLAGIGMGDPETRTLGMERALREADCLIGAERMLKSVGEDSKEQYIATSSEAIEKYIRESPHRNFAVLFSGDVGFYSGAKGLLNRLKDMDVELLSGIGSLQYFCAKLRRSWEDVRPLSLHGRDCDFISEVRRNPAVFALVGGADGVHSALNRLNGADMGCLPVHVGQRLGYPDEQIVHGTAEELSEAQFDPLSVLLVENPDWMQTIVTHGIPDEAFLRDETPMTKSEVRAVSLSKLALTRNAVVYDVGSGSGSVSVECALQAEKGRVYAIEMKEKALALTKRNGERFHLTNLEVVSGSAPDAFADLPAPTHAFIGGSGGNMRSIIAALMRKNPEVRIVVNAVTLETLAELIEISREFEKSEVVEISVHAPHLLGNYRLMRAQNPVFIFTLQYARVQKNGGE